MDVIERLIVKVDDVFAEYLQRDSFQTVPVDLEEISNIISEKTGLEIRYVLRGWDSRRIKGRLLRYRDKADIETANSLNPCWERFVRCKELCHLLLDEEDYYMSSPTELVNELLEVVVPGYEPSKAVMSENLAELAAVELLFPMAMRGNFVDAITNEGWTNTRVAKVFRVPTLHIERALSASYREIIDSRHRQLLAEAKVSV